MWRNNRENQLQLTALRRYATPFFMHPFALITNRNNILNDELIILFVLKIDPCDQCATNAICDVDYDLGTALCTCPKGMIGYAYGRYGKCG